MSLRREHLSEVVFFTVAILLVCMASLIIGRIDSPNLDISPIRTDYCIEVGDNNCDGMITPDESGWKCVPSNGGPLLC